MFILLAAACAEPEDTDPQTDPPPLEYESTSCGEAAPVLDAAAVADGGEVEFNDGTFPTVLATATATDTDGDIDTYEFEVAWDEEVDGAVEFTPYNFWQKSGSRDGVEACTTNNRELELYIPVSGDPLVAGVEYEWAVVLVDSEGNRSEPWVEVLTAPGS